MMTSDLAYFCGLWIAEGSFERKIGRISITCGDNDVGEILESGAIFGVLFKKVRSDQWRENSYALLEAMRFLGMPLVKAPGKWLPDWVWSGKREWACELLAGLLDGDGYVRSSANKVGFTTASGRLARDIQQLLAHIGVMSRLTSVESKPTERVKVSSLQYRVEIYGHDLSILRSCVKPRIQRKAKLLNDVNPSLKTRRGAPYVYSHLMNIKHAYRGTKMPELAAAISTARKGSDITYETLARVLAECSSAKRTKGWKTIKQLISDDFYWDEVVSIEVNSGESNTPL